MSLLSNVGQSIVSIQKELGSWFSPSSVETSSISDVGSKAPSSTELTLPASDGKPTIITFLRHCGCPFAEKTFHDMRKLAATQKDIHFIAVSHSDQDSTDKWAEAIGGTGNVELMIDFERELYAAWGLGVSSYWHVLASLGEVSRLYKEEGIKNRWTESGSRWQTSGSFAIDGKGIVKWSKPAMHAGEVPDFGDAVSAVNA